jgi:hypothetical protein
LGLSLAPLGEIMPCMPRTNDQNKKIAEKILGTPPNMQKKKPKNDKVEQKLTFEETSRVR